MAKTLHHTEWHARWRENNEEHEEVFTAKTGGEPACRLYAMQKALELGKKNSNNDYTQVDVYEVDIMEERLDRYTKRSVESTLTPARVSGSPD